MGNWLLKINMSLLLACIMLNCCYPSRVMHNMKACSSDDIAGLVVFRGAICAYAYLSPKEPTSQAISDLKNDIINSLKSRLDILLDEGEDTANMSSNDLEKECGEILTGKPIHQRLLHELRKPLVLAFPRRVLIPWLSDVFIGDYLLPSETFEDLKDRCRELSIKAPVESSALLELETEAAFPIMTSSFWDLVNGNPISSIEKTKNRSHSTTKKSSKQPKIFNFNFQVALFVLLVAFLIGGTITIFNPAKVVH